MRAEIREHFILSIANLFCEFWVFYSTLFNTVSDSNSIELEDAGIKPRTVATLALAVRRSSLFSSTNIENLVLIIPV